MDIAALKNYDNWVKVTPADILRFVKLHGGWRYVFPNQLPLWAHQIRNYFNIEPKKLTLLGSWASQRALTKVKANINKIDKDETIRYLKNEPMFRNLPEIRNLPDPPPGPSHIPITDRIGNAIGERLALTGDVYEDEAERIWYQMSAGGTIYHFGADPDRPRLNAIYQSYVGQAATSVFKLVSPDDTGGSAETIIKNQQKYPLTVLGKTFVVGRSRIGDVGVEITVSPDLIEKDEWLQGSYNYSETVVAGFDAHHTHDMVPHEQNHRRGVYINPPDRHQSLKSRKFPSRWWLVNRTN